MAVSVSTLLAPILKKKLEGIEDIAQRIAAGKAPPPEEIVAVLDRTRCDESDLQEAVDRHERRASLLKQIEHAKPLRKKYAEIEAAIGKAEKEFDDAKAKLANLHAIHHEERTDLRFSVESANQAEKALIDYDNLPPDAAARLRDVRDRASVAGDAILNTQNEIKHQQQRLDDAVKQEEERLEDKRLNRGNDSFVESYDRAKNVTATRKAQLAEAVKAAAESEKNLVAVRRERDEVEAATRKQFGLN